MNDLLNKIGEILKKYIGNENDAILEQNVELSEFGMDSISFIHIVVELEELFDIEIPDEKLLMSEMGTLEKIVRVVQEVINSKETSYQEIL